MVQFPPARQCAPLGLLLVKGTVGCGVLWVALPHGALAFQTSVCCLPLLPQINGSLARAAIKELLGKGLIKEVAKSRAQQVRSRAEAIALWLCCLARLHCGSPWPQPLHWPLH